MFVVTGQRWEPCWIGVVLYRLDKFGAAERPCLQVSFVISVIWKLEFIEAHKLEWRSSVYFIKEEQTRIRPCVQGGGAACSLQMRGEGRAAPYRPSGPYQNEVL